MLHGVPVSSGVAVGRAFIIRFRGTPAFRRSLLPEHADEEVRRLEKAAGKAADEFRRHADEARGEIASELAAILEVHGLMASDPTFVNAVAERVRRDRVNAEWALVDVAREFESRLAAADSAAMRERAADVADVAREIGRQLGGGEIGISRELPRGTILVADELSPVAAARLDARRVRGLVMERGGPTSHASIIARSFGLPAVAGIPDLCEVVSPERPIVVDGDRGVVDPAPSKEKLRRALLRIREAKDRARRLRARSARPAATKDGVRVVVRANLELAEEVPALGRFQAEGVGLFRSEFLYLKASPRLPGVEEQRAAYEQLLEAARPHPVIVRTYDLGGEKGIGPASADNPALGLRGLRYCLAQPELFDTQLTALCLASRQGELKIMLPMVTLLAELRSARQHLKAAAARTGLADPPPLGIMVEVPVAAISADHLAALADFFSIGTNDLAQYALAVDRANPEVSSLYRPLHPAILRMVKSVVEAGAARNRPVAVCGEMAADPIGIGVLVGLEIRELSVTPVAIPMVKSALAAIHSRRARLLAERALHASEAAEVEKMFRQHAAPGPAETRAARVEKEEKA